MSAGVVDLSQHAARRRRRPPRPLRPFTVAHFEVYCSRLVFDDGKTRPPEPFQLDFAAEIFRAMNSGIAGYEVWDVLPEGNGKTTFTAELVLYGCDWAPRPWIPVGASSRDQAKILYTQCKGFVEDTPGLEKRFECFDGYRSILPLNPATGKKRPGRGIEICPWDPDSNDGVIPYPFFVCDELHRHPDMSLWRLWKGKCKKRTAVGVGISTAGQPGEEFETARDKMRDTAQTRTKRHGGTIYRGTRHSMIEFRLENPEKALDPKAVAAVNPLSLLTETDFAEELESPNFDKGDWMRLKCCIAARSASAAISDEEWAKAIAGLTALPPGERSDGGLDLGWKHDTTAFVQQVRMEDEDGKIWHLWDEARIVVPPRDGSQTHPDKIKAVLYAAHDRNPLDAVVMDMTDGEDLAAWMADELGVTVVDRPQGNNLAVADYKNVMRGLRTGALRRVHPAPMLTRQAMNAIAWRLPRGDTKFERPDQSRAKSKQDQRVIDALVAGGMVYTHVCEPEEETIDLDAYRITRL